MSARAGLALLALFTAGACVHSSPPKPIAPVIDEVLPATPDVVFAAALKAVEDEGLPMRLHEDARGVIETEYVDVASYAPLAASQYPLTERLVRFRIVAVQNPQGPGTRFSIVAMYQPFRTGYSDSERNARSIPRDHPGMVVARKLLDRTKAAIGGG
jgi:hypothetical protein